MCIRTRTRTWIFWKIADTDTGQTSRGHACPPISGLNRLGRYRDFGSVGHLVWLLTLVEGEQVLISRKKYYTFYFCWIIVIIMRIRFWISIRNSDFYRKPRLWTSDSLVSVETWICGPKGWFARTADDRRKRKWFIYVGTYTHYPLVPSRYDYSSSIFLSHDETCTFLLIWDREKQISAT